MPETLFLFYIQRYTLPDMGPRPLLVATTVYWPTSRCPRWIRDGTSSKTQTANCTIVAAMVTVARSISGRTPEAPTSRLSTAKTGLRRRRCNRLRLSRLWSPSPPASTRTIRTVKITDTAVLARLRIPSIRDSRCSRRPEGRIYLRNRPTLQVRSSGRRNQFFPHLPPCLLRICLAYRGRPEAVAMMHTIRRSWIRVSTQHSYSVGCRVRCRLTETDDVLVCYISYGAPARLKAAAVANSVLVVNEQECKAECSRARETSKFRCATISYWFVMILWNWTVYMLSECPQRSSFSLWE